MKKRLLLGILLATGLYFGCDTALYHLNDRFALPNIVSSETNLTKTSDPSSSITSLLDQSYTYLGQGSQCYVFESEEKEHVLKFFKHKRFRLHPALAWFSPYKEALKKKKWEDLKASCLLAYEKLPQESGLLHLHFAGTSHFKKKISISDKLKRTYEIDLDSHDWILQKKGKLLYPTLTSYMEKGESENAKLAIKNLITLLSYRMEQGIDDKDAALCKNVAFEGPTPLFIDIGSFSHLTTQKSQEEQTLELKKILSPLKNWLAAHYPDLLNDAHLAHFFQ